jgi:hypothetical protein
MIPVRGYSPEDLLSAARDLLTRTHLRDTSDLRSRGVWPRAAAHLCRQALEEALDLYWRKRMPGLELASMRAQLTVLPTYLRDESALDAAYLWGALSSACHHHLYELSPTAPELARWIESTQRLLSATSTSTPTSISEAAGR